MKVLVLLLLAACIVSCLAATGNRKKTTSTQKNKVTPPAAASKVPRPKKAASTRASEGSTSTQQKKAEEAAAAAATEGTTGGAAPPKKKAPAPAGGSATKKKAAGAPPTKKKATTTTGGGSPPKKAATAGSPPTKKKATTTTGGGSPPKKAATAGSPPKKKTTTTGSGSPPKKAATAGSPPKKKVTTGGGAPPKKATTAGSPPKKATGAPPKKKTTTTRTSTAQKNKPPPKKKDSGKFSLELHDVSREIDLSSQIARHKVTLSIHNLGPSPATTFEYLIPQHLVPHLALIKASEGKRIMAQQKRIEGKDGLKIPFKFRTPVPVGGTTKVHMRLAFTKVMEGYPAKIRQGDDQLVRYRDNHYLYTAYSVKTQKTKVIVPSMIESASSLEPYAQRSRLVEYGPYESIPALSVSPMVLHFENNAPFYSVTNLVKEIEVSHWGAISVEEHYEIHHTGAKLTGPFSRNDFTRYGSPSAVEKFQQRLPSDAFGIYYRDTIGNISSSALGQKKTYTALDLKPRFPLFGGWKVQFYMGYNLPLEKHLFTSGSPNYMLNMTLALDMADVVIENYILRVILPEGARNPKIITPTSVEERPTTRRPTYLDIEGRLVLEVAARNLLKDHNRPFQVIYELPTLSLLQEPLLLIGAVFVFCFTVIICSRINLSIVDEEPNAVHQQQRKLLDKLNSLRSQWEEEHEKFNQDTTGSKAIKAPIMKRLGEITKDLESLKGKNLGNLVKHVKKRTEITAKIFDATCKKNPTDALKTKLQQVNGAIEDIFVNLAD